MFPRLFVFDMIGTTVLPSEAIPEAFRRAVAAAGVELTDEAIQAVRGKSKREAIAALLPEQEDSVTLDEVYGDFKSRLDAHYRDGGAEAISGAEETFSWCRSVGARIALTTGFDRDIAGLLLESLGWQQLIDQLICNDDVPAGRPAPFLILRAMALTDVTDSLAVASIGDTVSDLEAGNNAAVGWNFGVLSGAHDRDRLSVVSGAIVIPSVLALPDHEWS